VTPEEILTAGPTDINKGFTKFVSPLIILIKNQITQIKPRRGHLCNHSKICVIDSPLD